IFFFQAEDGIRDRTVTGVQTCALPISRFVQFAAFMSMNLDRRVNAQTDFFCHLANDEDQRAAAIRAFYDEYCAVMDLPVEFYLRSEERRVGKECRYRWGVYKYKKRSVG